MKKIFIESDTVRNNGFALAKKLIDENYVPDVMYVSMRGGATFGNAINEFLKLALGKNYKTVFATLVAHSYTGVSEKKDVVFDGWTFSPKSILPDQKVLIVDDICDSGSTLKNLSLIFQKLNLKKTMIRFAVHDYKHFNYEGDSVGFVPDYFCNKYEINSKAENIWVHYLGHELIGLTQSEFLENYLKKYPTLEKIFKGLI